MRILFARYARSFMRTIFWAFLVALMFTAFSWLMALLTGRGIAFLATLCFVYLVLVAADLLYKIVSFFAWWFRLRQIMRRFDIPSATAAKGLFVYGLHKSNHFNQWTKDDFIQSLVVAQAIDDML